MLAVALAAGSYLRLEAIGEKSMSHPEMWVPLIPVPAELADPPMRPTIYDTLRFNLLGDTHPAGYYLGLWFWMKAFGHAAWVIRLPSALCGIAAILLVFLLGRKAGHQTTGCVAALLLAFSGYHAAWSGFARMYSAVCCLGLLSSILLISLVCGSSRPKLLATLYVLVTVAGVSTHVFYWPLLLSQICWTLFFARGRGISIPAAFNLQVLGVLLGSPFIAFAAHQSHHPVATLSSDGTTFARELVQFAMLLPREGFTDLFAPSSALLFPRATPLTPLGWLWLALCLCLFVAGARSLYCTRENGCFTATARPWPRVWFGAAAVSSGVVWAFAWLFKTPPEGIRTTAALGFLPWVIAGLGILSHKLWRLRLLPSASSFLQRAASSHTYPLFLAVVTFLSLWAFSQIRPVLNPRGFLLLSPYVLVVLAAGIASLGKRVWLIAPVCALLGYLHVQSVIGYGSRLVDPLDFRAFAFRIQQQIRASDLIFFRRGWDTTPILFHIPPSRYRFIAADYCGALEADPSARVWELRFYGQPNPPEVGRCLAKYELRQRIRYSHAMALLYTAPEVVPSLSPAR